MMILTNTAAENAYAPSLFPSAATPVELEEQESSAASQSGIEDSVTLSNEALAKVQESEESDKSEDSSEKAGSEEKKSDTQELSEDEKKSVDELKKRDQEVRTHEQQHIAAGGPYVKGGASYSYQSGPDGKRYAVGGEVNIDTSPVSGDPDATISKMQTVRAAALAPAEPSGQDRSVASQASSAINAAHAEKAKMETEEREESKESDPEAPAAANSGKKTDEKLDISDIKKENRESEDKKVEKESRPTQTAPSPYAQSFISTGSLVDFAA